MFFLQITNNSSVLKPDNVLMLGSVILLSLVVTIIAFMVLHQRKIYGFNKKVTFMEEDKKEALMLASIRFQEEERTRIAADLHDDAGPLLATVRLYLNENLMNQDPATMLQSIYNAKSIVDDTIRLIRNISHNLMPPTLRNFGLESAVNDLFQKITGSGRIYASARFHDYKRRLTDDQEALVFRILQELINNIIKHSGGGFIHLTQSVGGGNMFFRLSHDGNGLMQEEFDRLFKESRGLGLKNINSRTEILQGRILFEQDDSKSHYKITLQVPRKYQARPLPDIS